jgi:hypothetical protein
MVVQLVSRIATCCPLSLPVDIDHLLPRIRRIEGFYRSVGQHAEPAPDRGEQQDVFHRS